MPDRSPDPRVESRQPGPSDPLWVALGIVLAVCAGIVGGLLAASTGSSLAQAISGGAGCFAATLTLYLLVLGAVRGSSK
jgi:hypothetical protein